MRRQIKDILDLAGHMTVCCLALSLTPLAIVIDEVSQLGRPK